MGSFRLLNYEGAQGETRPGILADGDAVVDLRQALPGKPWAVSTLAVLEAWNEALPALHALADAPQNNSRRLATVKLLAPLLYPPAIYCTGANYMAHAEEMSAEGSGVDKTTTQPYLFLKSGPHCIIGPGAEIRLPGVSKKVDWEAECAVVIGKPGRNIKVHDAMEHVAGYTIANDYAIRDYLENWYRPNLRVKSRDGATVLGPWLVDAADIEAPPQLALRTLVNGRQTQSGNTR
ncbi:MAG TPA: fumarylacetoacetate hydrolase family protein, partial [Burkholderiales bacterium]|nr:fumarylacetoacetate hydrolase family protein [Burkholderiales bacterium]